MWKIRTFVGEWLLPGREARSGSTRRPSRRASVGKRPELEPVEARILLSTAEVATIRATPLLVDSQAKASVEVSEVGGIALRNRRGDLTASLTSNGRPVEGLAVIFRIGNRVVGTARTDADGVATLSNVRVGRLKVRNYAARTVVVFKGNSQLMPVVRRGPLTVSRTASALSGVTATGVYGGAATLSAVLGSKRGEAAGKPVLFALDGRAVGVATTDAQGVATLPGVSLAGLNAGAHGVTARFAGDIDYYKATATGTLTIARATTSITLGNLSQTYGATTQPTATTGQPGLPVELSYTDASGHAAAQPFRAGTYTVTARIADPNYIGSAVGTLVVAPAAVGISRIDAMSKAYDGTTAATVDSGSVVLTGVVAGDSVSIDASHATASFASDHVGADQAVTIAGLALTGPDASNYVLSQSSATATASITPRALTVAGIAADDKVYDGTTAATFSLSPGAGLDGVVGADDVSLVSGLVTASFDSKSAGQGKAVTFDGFSLSGGDSGNYVLSPVTAAADITRATLTVAGIAAADKVYDGTAAATLDASGASLGGVIGADDVSLDASAATGSFDTKDADNSSKAVTISGLALAGADAGNYQLAGASAFAYISPKVLAVTGVTAGSRVYDATTAASLDASAASLVGVVPGDDVALNTAGVSGSFVDRNVGTAKAVIVSGLALAGPGAGNYIIAAPGVTADVTPLTLTMSPTSTATKTYDGTTSAPPPIAPSLAGVIGGDSVALDASGATGATLADKNVGTNKVATEHGLALSGVDAGNYLLDPTYLVNVTPASVSVTGITAPGKVYDGTTAATLDTSGVSFAGVVIGDDVTFDASSAVGSFADRDAGTGKTVTVTGLTKSGADAGNYAFAFPTPVTATITPKALTVTGMQVDGKVYDGTTAATIAALPGGVISGLVNGDDVSIDQAATSAGATAAFADKDAGTGKTVTVTGVQLTGADAGNYTVSSATGSADISKATITLSGVAASKTYDGTTDVSFNLGGASLGGVIGADDVSLDASAATGSYADKDVGTGKAITANGFALAGADAGNYTLAVDPITGDIASKILSIEGFTATDRTYDGTTGVTVGAAGVNFHAGDLVAGEDVAFDYSSLAAAAGSMADKNAGVGKAVTITGLSVTGADAGNYKVVASTTVNIAKATLTVTGIPNLTKSYDENQYFVSINTSGAALSGIIGADTVTLNTSGIFGVSTSANVGTWNVYINGLALGGTDAGNYNLGTVIVSGTIQGP
ncbi:beta strand repeat-containing protein [Aquisphaera giovannonii]|nr:YDG domain-containing protein [Aquisphaera giovannonii]